MDVYMEDVAEYIYTALIEEGITVNMDDIGLILDMQLDYMISIGAATAEDE